MRDAGDGILLWTELRPSEACPALADPGRSALHLVVDVAGKGAGTPVVVAVQASDAFVGAVFQVQERAELPAAGQRPPPTGESGVAAPRAPVRGPVKACLDRRELDILRLVADGLDTTEIAQRLNYSERTIKYIIHVMLSRLQLRNRPHAVAFAFRNGLM